MTAEGRYRHHRRGRYDRLPAGVRLVTRGSRWGNPHPVDRDCPRCRVVHDRADAIARVERANDALNLLIADIRSYILRLRQAMGGPEDPVETLARQGEELGMHAVIDLEVDLGVSSREGLAQISSAVHARGEHARVHLKIDTGLSRNGASEREWEELVRAALDDPRIELVGVWSHLARADEPEVDTTREQGKRLVRALEVVRALGGAPEYVHLANSAGILVHPETHHTLVRSGIAL